MRYAEVIGDPIAQSKSPIIHQYWLEQLSLDGDYRRTQVPADGLADYLRDRRSDPEWRGCNVTIPHKERIIPLLDELDADAQAIGAVNCVAAQDGRLTGYNTDIDGVAVALDSVELDRRKVAIIGAGGGARAVVAYLARRHAEVIVLVRNPAKAEPLHKLGASDILPLDRADTAFEGVAAIVNATSLGMVGADAMPSSMLQAIRTHSAGATLFDLVTTPARTEFLSCGDRTVDGLTMLIGQARRAFELFIGHTPPPGDAELRRLLGANQ